MTDGILPINKPEGLSSARVVDRVKKKLKVKKAGHTGTLDPFATGLLPLALGKATRLSRFFLSGRKQYRARVRLGIETDTYDKTGRTLHTADPDLVSAISPEQIIQTAAAFRGKQEQTAPAFSALKHKGQPLYKLARKGEMIQKPPRQINIYEIRVLGLDLPEFELAVACSAGTYIRSLAHDIGERLGCGAHLSGLCRTGVGQFTSEQAVDLEILERMDKEEVAGHVVPMAEALNFMPGVTADEALAQKIRHGQKLGPGDLPVPGADCAGFVRVLDNKNRLLAVVEPRETPPGYNYCCVFNG